MGDRLTLRGLEIRVGDQVLIDDVDLDLEAGEVTGLVGRSGSGKTLTARALLGLVELNPGVVRADLRITVGTTEHCPYAKALAKGPRARARAFRRIRGDVVGYLPQNARRALDPLMRVGTQVRAAARLAARGTDPLPWLARAGFADPERVARLHPHELSGGMAQRAVIAQALARGSRFLLADEPTTGLDPTVQRGILRELRGVAAEGIGVLFITHDLRVLPGFADRLVVMDRGRVVESTETGALAAGKLSSEAGMRLVQATRRIAGGRLG